MVVEPLRAASRIGGEVLSLYTYARLHIGPMGSSYWTRPMEILFPDQMPINELTTILHS